MSGPPHVPSCNTDFLDSWLPVDTERPFGAFAPTPGQALLLAATRHIHVHGALRKRCTHLLHRLRPAPIDVLLAGSRWRLYLRNNVCEGRFVIKQHRYEKREIDAIVGALDAEPQGVFVDVGANVGLYSLLVTARHPTAQIIAFEPNPHLFRRLVFNIAANGLSDRVHPHCLAVGEAEKDARLSFHNIDAGAATLTIAAEQGIMVRIRPLEAVLTEQGATCVAAMKLDVEGYEDRVLLPFLQYASRESWPLVIILEHCCRERWEKDCLALCMKEGYDLAHMTNNNAILARRGSK